MEENLEFLLGIASVALSLLTAIIAVYIQHTFKMSSVGWKAVAISCWLIVVRRGLVLLAQLGVLTEEVNRSLDWLLATLISITLMYGFWSIYSDSKQRLDDERDTLKRAAEVERNLQMRMQKSKARRK